MIDIKELLKGVKFEELSPEIQANLLKLLEIMNKIRVAYAKPMIVTSGLRSMADHLRIYREKGITDTSRIPMKSRHLLGLAVDIYDPKGELKKWIMENLKLMEELGVYLEDFSATPTWVHFQIVPTASGKRFFKP